MTKTKTQKPPTSVRNQVLLTVKNLKFIDEHSIAFPKRLWIASHEKLVLLLMTVTLLTCIVAMFVDFLVIPACLLGAVYTTLTFFDNYSYLRRIDKFHKELLHRGGTTIHPWNLRLIKNNAKTTYTTVFVLYLILTCVFIGLIIFSRITQDPVTFNIFPFCFPYYFYAFSVYSGVNTPFIFMDIDEAMLFGGALFSYDVLSGILSTSDGKGFELYYEGKKSCVW